MRNIKLTLSYDGTDFHGWQTQPGFRTVQETLEDAIADADRRARIRVNASGRTDTGVHAVGQVVNFHSDTKLSAGRARPGDQRPSARRRRGARGRRRAASRSTPTATPSASSIATSSTMAPVPDLFLRRYCHHTRYRARRGGDGAGGGRVCAAGTISTASRRNGPTARRACAPSRTWPSTASATGSGSMWRRTASCTIWCGPSPAR